MGECTFGMLVPGVFFFCYFAPGYTFSSNGSEPYGDPELKWKAVSRALVGEMPQVNPRVLSSLPDFLRVPASADYKSLFIPETGAREVPVQVMRILQPSAESDHAISDFLVKVVCYVDRISVRVSRSLFTRRRAHRYLKLGRCSVNSADNDFYYFFYSLNTRRCSFTEMLMPDFLSVVTMLRYNPWDGAVLWEVPFTVTIQCRFHRFHHVYSMGIEPILRGGTISKDLAFGPGPQLLLIDISETELIGPQTYNLGDTMYFEASLSEGLAPGERLYVNKCYITASEDSSSDPQYIVIDKFGCMLAGRITYENRFLTANLKSSVKFAVSALIFREMLGSDVPAGQEFMLYMHCEIARGPPVAATDRKSCSYVNSRPRWEELYDDNSVCTCCRPRRTCGSLGRTSNTLYASTALVVDTHALEPTSKVLTS